MLSVSVENLELGIQKFGIEPPTVLNFFLGKAGINQTQLRRLNVKWHDIYYRLTCHARARQDHEARTKMPIFARPVCGSVGFRPQASRAVSMSRGYGVVLSTKNLSLV